MNNATVAGFLPNPLYKYIVKSTNVLLLLLIMNKFAIFNERKRELKFFSDFRGRIEKLQESNMIKLKNRIYS